ncbi:MAG: pilus assembly protein N-terminal domain-containing protein, partial [Candidatus Omnitrophica bacterium]|nr:pilus assembly protein N-terminal domain-containing protein [Candidatus Omnitrophota bacterium]
VEEIHLLKGELESVYVQDLTRLAVANPDVVDVNDATSDEIVIVGKDIGQTAIFIWDVGGKRTVMVYVHNQDLNIVKKRLEELFKEAGIYEIDITLNEKEGSVVLSGFLPKEKRMAYELIIGKFSSEILDLVKDEQNDDLIQIDLQITELNETLLKGLGVEWFSAGQEDSVSISGGGFGGTNNPIYAETPPETDGSIKDFFKIGQFNRTSTFVAQINAYLTEGKARLLSAPKLVTVSGEEASFLVGGEIPITTTTVNENGAAENVEYKEFGVGMTIIPTIRKNKIDIQLNMEVSDIDPTNSQGGDVAFTTRTAQTRLYLDDGQTIIIAGLIRQTDSEEVRKVPFLADIPVLGALFRTRGTPVLNEDKEL